MATHFAILAWDILWNRGTWQAIMHGVAKEADTTEGLSTNPCTTEMILFDGKQQNVLLNIEYQLCGWHLITYFLFLLGWQSKGMLS